MDYQYYNFRQSDPQTPVPNTFDQRRSSLSVSRPHAQSFHAYDFQPQLQDFPLRNQYGFDQSIERIEASDKLVDLSMINVSNLNPTDIPAYTQYAREPPWDPREGPKGNIDSRVPFTPPSAFYIPEAHTVPGPLRSPNVFKRPSLGPRQTSQSIPDSGYGSIPELADNTTMAIQSAIIKVPPPSSVKTETSPGVKRWRSKSFSSTCHCGVELRNRSTAIKHQLQHEKPFRCDLCSRKEGFATQNDLERHRKSVHGASPRIRNTNDKFYICQACKPAPGSKLKKWPRLDNFRAHIKRKHAPADLEQFIKACEVEGSAFTDSGSMYSGIEPSPLNQPYETTTQENLFCTIAEQIPLEGKPSSILFGKNHAQESANTYSTGVFQTQETCGRHVKDLKEHILLHQNERPEKCSHPTCEYHMKGFARKYDKNRHMRTHYKGTMVCGFCPGSGRAAEKSFNRADVFKRHMVTVHGVEQTPPNSRNKAPSHTNVSKRRVHDRGPSGSCSICTVTFADAQKFYEHLDDCVLSVVRQADPQEAINEKLLSSVVDAPSVRETMETYMLPTSIGHDAYTSFSEGYEGEQEEYEDDETPRFGKTPRQYDVARDAAVAATTDITGSKFTKTENTIDAPTAPMAPTTAPTMTDEGYHSMDKEEKPSANEDETASNADSVRTDNRDSALPRHVKEQLSTYFAQEILDNVQLPGEELVSCIDSIYSSLPELFREFSTLVAQSARAGIEERACIFVRHQRNQIARNMRTILSNRPDRSDAPGSHDRISLLWGEHRTIDDQPDDRMTADLLQEIKGPGEDLINLPDIPEARKYLIESLEYKWLLSRILALTRTMPTLSTDVKVRKELLDVIPGDATSVDIELEWHFSSFAREQYESFADVELRQVLCCSGLADAAYAAPCIEYAELLWPRLGKELVQCLSVGMRDDSIRMSGSLSDGTTLIIEPQSQTTTVSATGPRVSLVEISEVLAWICSACRASPTCNQLSYCRPRIVDTSDPGNCSLKIAFDYPEIETVTAKDEPETNARCWHQIFRNPTVAYGYPIPLRHGERGLEVSLSIMTCLGATSWAIEFNQTLFLKGFCSLFVPMMVIGQSIIWHFLLQGDGSRISYNQGLALEPVPTDISVPSLQDRRHFVGWTSPASIIAGTKQATYDVNRSASELSKAGIGALSNVSISGGKVLTFGASFVRGNKDTPVPIANCRPYEMQLIAASEMNTLFYDTYAQKAWLVDGATALLHVSRAWLSSSYARFIPKETTDQFTHSSACDGRQSALDALILPKNRQLKLFSEKKWITETFHDPSTNGSTKIDKCKETWWCWEDLVQLKWNVFEQIHDHVVRLKTSPDTQLQVPFISKVLEGFDIIDILSDNTQIRPRMIDLKSSSGGWLDIAMQNEAINIFGSGFGDLIAPEISTISKDQSSCGRHSAVPEGLDYLAAPLYVLKDIAFRHRTRKDGSVSLGPSSYWIDPETTLGHCPCAMKNNKRKCMASLSQLQSLPVSFCKKRQQDAKIDIFASHPLGAVIFGDKPNWITKKRLGKRKNQSQDEEKRNTRPRDSDSGVDLAASSSSGLSSSRDSQSSIADSGLSRGSSE